MQSDVRKRRAHCEKVHPGILFYPFTCLIEPNTEKLLSTKQEPENPKKTQPLFSKTSVALPFSVLANTKNNRSSHKKESLRDKQVALQNKVHKGTK